MAGITATRADAARAVRLLCQDRSVPGELLRQAGKHVAAAVPHDTLNWQIYDPQAMVPVAAFSGRPVPFGLQLAHCEIEQSGGEPDAFRRLARSRRPVTTLARATVGEPASSRRFRELLAPAGIRHELRAALVHQGSCWGTLILSRHDGPDFSGAELRWIHGVAGYVAAALKRRLLGGATTTGPGGGPEIERPFAESPPQPGVIMIRPGVAPHAPTTPARQWLDILARRTDWGDHPLLALHSAAVRARRQYPGRTASLHLPTELGWVSVDAAADLDSDQVTIVVQPARCEAMIPVLTSAYGLTARQQAVVGLVMRGLSSRQISDRLTVSTDTVHDHLQAAYAKTGTSGRGQLRHRLALDAWSWRDDG